MSFAMQPVCQLLDKTMGFIFPFSVINFCFFCSFFFPKSSEYSGSGVKPVTDDGRTDTYKWTKACFCKDSLRQITLKVRGKIECARRCSKSPGCDGFSVDKTQEWTPAMSCQLIELLRMVDYISDDVCDYKEVYWSDSKSKVTFITSRL